MRRPSTVADTLCTEPEALWSALGARPAWTTAAEHDRLMTRVSHVPQLVANALARTLAQAGVAHADLGPGGRDMTRLAGSSPELWRDLFRWSAPEAAATTSCGATT